MKKIIVLGMLCVGAISFGRDFEYHEVRDIVKPMESSLEELNQLSPQEWKTEIEYMNKNIEKYKHFHAEL